MASFLGKVERHILRLFHREPSQRKLVRLEFWLLLLYLVLLPERILPGSFGEGVRLVDELLFLMAIVFAIPLATQWVFTRLLWKVRDRLIVTYLLMGLAPIVLFVTLAGIAAYIFAGQFAIFAATSEINVELTQLEAENHLFATHISQHAQASPRSSSFSLPELVDLLKDKQHSGLMVTAFLDGKRLSIEQVDAANQSDAVLPSWSKGDFRGIVSDGGRIYLRSLSTYQEGGHATTVISSLALSPSSLEQVARDLGQVTVFSKLAKDRPGEEDTASNTATRGDAAAASPEEKDQFHRRAIVGGSRPAGDHFYDILVPWASPLNVVDWKSGAPQQQRQQLIFQVTSRPSVLYQRLFSNSNSPLQIGTFIRDALIGIALLFSLLELVAFVMAVRLNRTITRSIHDLYQATSAIDQGNLSHRISVRRNDQLAALSSSFNRMTASLERLLKEQREKERLQNELAIAQEVQANLFPSSSVFIPSLELHGVCLPARTVSGDYYDFLLFSDTRLGLALGDISGKGISAALLMATLHSAVRAYRLVGEELAHPSVPALPVLRVAGGSDGPESDYSGWFAEPGRILAMLNRHLYRSTQPEKYATLFLGHYDGDTRKLTYSNGGQLPPLLLHTDDRVTRLDCGGTVVGLMDNMTYQQETVTLKSGDILVAYSDGVTEPENEFGEFGEKRLMEIIRRNRHLPLPSICDQVMQALRSWIGEQEQPDDITLVLARQR